MLEPNPKRNSRGPPLKNLATVEDTEKDNYEYTERGHFLPSRIILRCAKSRTESVQAGYPTLAAILWPDTVFDPDPINLLNKACMDLPEGISTGASRALIGMLEPNANRKSSELPLKNLVTVEENEKNNYEFRPTVKYWGCLGQGRRTFLEESESSHPEDSAISETAATWHPSSHRYSCFQPSAHTIAYYFSPTTVPAPKSSPYPV
ncbi:hypothetical protein BU17DRAFT_71658 [Hysterangium stoloniferum]|nr:hypothetical protein BU17DRAFT_71658 [Hysterangium stoloniferum]